jgi:ElaA protein
MISWKLCNFDELNKQELYQLLQLRAEIFVVEQNCPYQDLDGKDQEAFHLMAFEDEQMIAYSRILKPGLSYINESSIGRVIVRKTSRGSGLGKALMQRSIDICKMHFPGTIKISAQEYLERFYVELGFTASHERYLEDGIPHVAMIMNPSN